MLNLNLRITCNTSLLRITCNTCNTACVSTKNGEGRFGTKEYEQVQAIYNCSNDELKAH